MERLLTSFHYPLNSFQRRLAIVFLKKISKKKAFRTLGIIFDERRSALYSLHDLETQFENCSSKMDIRNRLVITFNQHCLGFRKYLDTSSKRYSSGTLTAG